MNHPTSPNEKHPRICLLADGTTATPLVQNEVLPWMPPVVDFITFGVSPINGLYFVAPKAWLYEFNACASGQNVTDLEFTLLDNMRSNAPYQNKAVLPALAQIIVPLRKTLYLNLGDTVTFTLSQQQQASGASLWPYSDSNYLEVSFHEA